MVPTLRFFVAANWFLAFLEPDRDAPDAFSDDCVKEVRFSSGEAGASRGGSAPEASFHVPRRI
eukprot:6647613-Pyramimonas_sp.AAC.1